MQLASDGTLIVSATDLVGFLECDHLATLELGAAAGDLERPVRRDPELDLIRKRGFEHEHTFLEQLRADGLTIVEIDTAELRTAPDLLAAQARTLEAMQAGADVVYQATFFDGRWRGHADFLLRRPDRPSALGSWSYDVADTKLAHRVKAAAILQMCVYADLLERLQGVPPETISVVTGDRSRHDHRLADYAAYYRSAKARFEARVFGDAAAGATYPEPVDHCRVCAWYGVCADRRRADDHLSLVAGLTRSQAHRLVESGVGTRRALARARPTGDAIPIPPRILERLTRQAAIQVRGEDDGRLLFELIPPDPDDPGKGLASLPEPSPLDLFFDIEADPWALADGLEYLFGYVEEADGEPRYTALWAHDRASEKAMFETFVDFVIERLARDPDMHVYHYAAYESGALKRLMQRHATREEEVDRLLRGRVLVDLYQAVRTGIRASVESYSLKKIEKLYLPAREGPITEAGFSVVEYERWLETGDATLLDALADYNRDDCVSTLELRRWLEARRPEAAPLYPDGVVPRPAPVDGAPSQDVELQQQATARRVEALTSGVPADPAERTEEQQARWLLAQLLDWHRREAKPQWWNHFRLRDAPMEDLFRDSEALAGLEYTGISWPEDRSIVHRYRFDPRQDSKIDVGASWLDPATGASAGTCVAFDPLVGTIELKRAANRTLPHPAALIVAKPYDTSVMRDALGRIADHVIAAGIAGDGPYRSVRDLVLRRPPRVDGATPGEPLRHPGEDPLAAALRIAAALDRTVLPIQGPPGTGKTWTGARMIVELARRGRRVGITAQSHKAIAKLLEDTAEAALEADVPLRAIQRCDDDEAVAAGPGIVRATGNADVDRALANGSVDVVAGTSWLFARAEMEARPVDVLFVDEAGQASLATVVSLGGAARSIVLLGDPNQLPQVSQGTHPEGAEASALEHLVAGERTIAPDRGLFLDTTYRLHPDVNAYVSPTFYEGRLLADASTARQRLADGPLVEGTGVRHLSVVHRDGGSRSPTEAALVARLVDALVGRPWTDRHGVTRPLEPEDVLVVAPYNAHVAEVHLAIERTLGVRGRIGTVDRFQGQEAPVAIYTMASATVEDAPRDFGFLYSGNRLNVAISRARGTGILVCSPALLAVACRTPEQMRLVNALCRLVEVAAGTGEAVAGAGDIVAPEAGVVAAGPEPLTLGL